MPDYPEGSPPDFSTDLSTPLWLTVDLATPRLRSLHYRHHAEKQTPSQLPAVGQWVIAPLGRRTLIGLVSEVLKADPGEVPADRLRAIDPLAPALPTLSDQMLSLYRFAAGYYRRPLGAVLATAIPPYLRAVAHHRPKKTASLVERLLTTPLGLQGANEKAPPPLKGLPPLTKPQAEALSAISRALAGPSPPPFLLHGVTGSGKTRVYIETMQALWQRQPDAQILLLVPEIGLTPALEQRMRMAFPQTPQTSLHSSMTDLTRAQSWVWAATGQARLVIGTRLAILTPMPRLALIIVDEEHDASYKQQDGLRYSARDLAVYRGHQGKVLVLLGSATPSLETLHATARGSYKCLRLPYQATGAPRAQVRLVDTLTDPAVEGLSSTTRKAIADTLAAGNHVLVFLNRRGWAPVLGCDACPWTATCRDCQTPLVLHQQNSRWRLVCHHCAATANVPQACPDCGAVDLAPIGRGVQRIEATLQVAFPEHSVVRVDRDSVRSAREMEQVLDGLAGSPARIIVGTQMMAKGHDVPGLELVVIADTDAQINHPDFRAPEWLLQQLIQVAGRAGRHRQTRPEGTRPAQVLIQTRYPQHPLFQALLADQPDAYAERLLEDRRTTGLPPFGYMALLRLSDTKYDRLHAWSQGLYKALKAMLEMHKNAAERPAADPWSQTHLYPAAPDYPERQGPRIRWHLVIEAPTRGCRALLAQEAESYAQRYPGVDLQIEIDPLSQN